MLKIGLTGGIGSGKTTVARVFELLDIPVYYADDAAKKLMQTNESLKKKIIALFGEQSYRDGELNRKHLASIVFNDKTKLDQLNALTHPATIEDAEEWIKKQNSPYIIKEAALLFESGAAENLDYTIGVYAPESLRIQRVMQRDHIAAEEVMKRISRQMDEDMKMKLCDFIITNDENKMLIPQVLALHRQFCSGAGK
jgi:dephospho-CoA kinase